MQPTTRDDNCHKKHDAEFKSAHLSLVDLIDDEGALEEEQATLDAHNDLVTSLAVHIEALLTCVESSAATKIDERKVPSCRLKWLQECLSAAHKAINTLLGEKRTHVNLNMMNSCVILRM